MNYFLKSLLFILAIGFMISCNSKQKSISFKSFTQEEGKVILDNAIKVEPISERVVYKEWIKLDSTSKDSFLMTTSTQSFNVYVATDAKGVLIRNPTKQDSVSALTTGEPPPIVVTPYCVGHCPPGCEKEGCMPAGGGCSEIVCTGECNVANQICSNYGTFFGATSIHMQ